MIDLLGPAGRTSRGPRASGIGGAEATMQSSRKGAMQRPSVRPKHHVSRKTARPRPGVRRPRTPEQQPPTFRPAVLVGVALALFVGIATVWLVETVEISADAAVAPVAAKAPERRVVKLPKPERGRWAPAREPGLAAEDSAGVFPGGDAELAALPEDPATEAREAASPPNPLDLEIGWRNEGEEVADASEEGYGLDPEATDDELDELGEIDEFDADDEQEFIVPQLAELDDEEAFLGENDEDFRGRDDLAEFERVADNEPELEPAAAP